MACYKSALIDLDSRWGNKGQAMQSYLTLGELTKAVELYFTADDPIESSNYLAKCISQPDRLRRVDTCTFKRMKTFTEEEILDTHKANGLYEIKESEAIVGSANIDEIAERGGNDLSPQ